MIRFYDPPGINTVWHWTTLQNCSTGFWQSRYCTRKIVEILFILFSITVCTCTSSYRVQKLARNVQLTCFNCTRACDNALVRWWRLAMVITTVETKLLHSMSDVWAVSCSISSTSSYWRHHQQVNERRSMTLAEQCHGFRVARESTNVLFDPVQCGDYVEQCVVARCVGVAGAQEACSRHTSAQYALTLTDGLQLTRLTTVNYWCQRQRRRYLERQLHSVVPRFSSAATSHHCYCVILDRYPSPSISDNNQLIILK